MKLSVFVALVFSLTACQQNPYGNKTPADGAPPPKREKPEPLPGSNSLQVAGTMHFTEGQQGEYAVRGLVKTGTPVIQFGNLPAGVTYDKVAQKLFWTPDYAAANDPRDPAILIRIYPIRVSLFSSEDMSTELATGDIDLIVKDNPKPAAVKSPLDMRGTEGLILSHVIQFEDQEYPSGPFEIALVGLPLEAELIWPDRKVPSFELRWLPPYTKISNNSMTTFTGEITIYNPRGKRLQFSVRWNVWDNQVPPTTMGPTSVAQPGDLDFMVMAEDLNGENAPDWQVKVKPPYGFFTVTTQPVTGSGLPKSAGLVSWKGIPKDKLGTVQSVELNACVDTFLCTTHKATLLPMVVPPNSGAH